MNASVAPAAGPRQATVLFLFVAVLANVMAFGLIVPVLPHLVQEFVGGDVARAALWVGVFGTAYAGLQFLASPVQGALSDRYGRRPVLLGSALGLGLDCLLLALADSLPLLLIARMISGVTAASASTANAYIADVTAPDKRAAAFGLIGSAFGIGFVVGPAIGGFLGGIDLRLPFWVAAGFALMNCLYGWFVLPESLPPARRSRAIDWRRANPLCALGLLRSFPGVLGLATLVLIGNVAHYVLPATFVLYADYRYGWGPGTVGIALGFVGVCNALVQVVLVKHVVKRWGERRALLAGLASGAAGFALMGLAPNGAAFLAAVPVLALWGLAGPSTQSLLSARVDEQTQGRLQGSVTSLASLAGIFAPFVFTSVFAAFIGARAIAHLPGAAFFLAALLLCAAFALATAVAQERAAN